MNNRDENMAHRITRFVAAYLDRLVKDAYASSDGTAIGLAGKVADEVIDHGRYREGDALTEGHERLVNELVDAIPCGGRPQL